MMRVAHIAPHIGGGVGSVLKSFFVLSKEYGLENHLYCLDICKSNFLNLEDAVVKKDGLFYKMPDRFEYSSLSEAYDVILIHYWNHPLTSKFLSDVNFPAHKTMFWVHNSGLYEPHIIPSHLAYCASKILFTSACSYGAPNLQNLLKQYPHKFGVVHSTRDLSDFLRIGHERLPKIERNNMLYVGTVSGAKMHEQACEIFAALSKCGFCVRVVGGPDSKQLKEDVADLGGNIEIYGEVEDILPFFLKSDIFIYPLNSGHYGTGEQVILEAMAAGLPVVAFGNPAEKAILGQGGGLIVETVEEFIDGACQLARSSKKCDMISRAAHEKVCAEFSVEKMTSELVYQIKNLSNGEGGSSGNERPKIEHLDDLELFVMHSFFDGDGLSREIASASSGAVDIVFNQIKNDLVLKGVFSRWLGDAKGAPSHYQKFFPESKIFSELVKKITEFLDGRSQDSSATVGKV